MAKFFGSVSVEDTQKRLQKKFGERDANEAARKRANALVRGDKADIQPRAKAAAQTLAKKKPKTIKIDPNVKPIAPTIGPIGIVTALKDAFTKSKSVGKKVVAAGREAGKQAAAAGKSAFQEATAASAAKPGEKTVVPLRVKRPSIFKKPTGNTVKVAPQKGFEKLADEQGVPQSQTFNQARGIKPGQSGPLPNLLRKRAAAKAREVNLGGTRSDRSRGTRARPVRAVNPNPPAPNFTKSPGIIAAEKPSLGRRLAGAAGAGAALGIGAAKFATSGGIKKRIKTPFLRRRK